MTFRNPPDFDGKTASYGDRIIYGTEKSETIKGTDHSEAIFGGKTVNPSSTGNDVIQGNGGTDVIFGGDGNDSIDGGSGRDLVFAGSGDDTVRGGTSSDTLFGGSGQDILDYSDRDDAVKADLQGNHWGLGTATRDGVTDVIHNFEGLYGGGGNDFVKGSTENDVLKGNGGNDTLFGNAGGDKIFGGAGDDSLSGEDGFDSLYGGDGADKLFGGNGNDVLEGNTGDDTLTGGRGADLLNGGTGLDYADYTDSSAGVTIRLGQGTGEGGDAQGDTLVGIDGIHGSKFDDRIVGYDAESKTGSDVFTNEFYGAAGNDYLDGRGGDDKLFGGDGNDTLIGGLGRDTLDGGKGNDTIIFGRGDTASGGDGDDTFTIDDLLDNAQDKADANITIYGGANSEGGRDILDLTGLEGAKNTITDAKTGSGHVVLKDGTVINYEGIEGFKGDGVICFTPGTMIRTLGGMRAIETLKAGDMVLTRDSGMQPIRWIGSTTVEATGSFAPIRISAGAVPDLTSDLLVSPQHRMLIEGYRAELLFGEREVLASAKHMVDDKFVTVEEGGNVTYIHMLFDQHEVIFANGAATESYHPASYNLGILGEETRDELFAIFPELRAMPSSYGATARRILKGYEVNALAW